ncbi:MAG: DnaJ like chaperone protein [Alteromonadaceae bacterium]|jgi:DnaJ like chaperone protein
MKIWGKVFGFVFGLMLTKNIFGGLLGMWLGHTFDKGRSLNFNQFTGGRGNEQERQAVFFFSSFSVMGYIAKANGQVTSHEIAFASTYMDKLGLKGELRQQAQDAFRQGKSAEFDLENQLQNFIEFCGTRQDLLLLFLEIQIQVAFADGELDQDERKALHHVAKSLGYSAQQLDKLLEMIIAGAQFHQGQSNRSGVTSQQQLDNAYKLLGVNKEMSAKDIKKAYRKLMSQHHPDKLVAKGLPAEMMEVAKQKTQDIQAAYELISETTK